MHVAISKHCFRATARIGFKMGDFVMTDEHETIEMLLPWYVTGQLNAVEKAQVDTHIIRCKACCEMLAQEQQLKTDIAAIPIAVPQFSAPVIAYAQRSSLEQRGWQATRQTVSSWTARPMRVAAFATAQAAMLLIAFQLAQPAAPPYAEYRTLSSGGAASKANAIVMFNTETREADFRMILIDAGATIVGGPTETNAYFLLIEAGKRDDALERLRKQRQIVLAQPIDGE